MNILITALLACVLSTAAVAAPTIIYDSGKTKSIAQYTDVIKLYNPKKVKPITVFNPLPIVTPNLKAGFVKKRNINQPYLVNPIFIIGNDKMSMNWLVKNKELLRRIDAVGMLVNVDNRQELERIAKAAEGLKMIPAPAIDLAKQLNLTHYPVLISKQFIEQ